MLLRAAPDFSRALFFVARRVPIGTPGLRSTGPLPYSRALIHFIISIGGIIKSKIFNRYFDIGSNIQTDSRNLFLIYATSLPRLNRSSPIKF